MNTTFPVRWSKHGLAAGAHPTGRVAWLGAALCAGAIGSFAVAMVVGTGSAPAGAAQPSVGLGTAASYSVLAGSTVTNTGPTQLDGGLGLSPGTAVTGFPPGETGGATHTADAVALQAQTDLVTAWNGAREQATTTLVAGDLVGRTLVPGVYTSSGPLALSGALTLNAQGDPRSVFVFQVASTLITASASRILLINGAQACNVWWQIGSSATLGTNSSFIGTVMALASVTVTTNVHVEGRAMAHTGAVTLDSDRFVAPGCDLTTHSSPPPSSSVPSTSTSTSTSTASGSTTATSVSSTVASSGTSSVASGGSSSVASGGSSSVVTGGSSSVAGGGGARSTGSVPTSASGSSTTSARSAGSSTAAGVRASKQATRLQVGAKSAARARQASSRSKATNGASAHLSTTPVAITLSSTGNTLVRPLVILAPLLLLLGGLLLMLGRRKVEGRHR